MSENLEYLIRSLEYHKGTLETTQSIIPSDYTLGSIQGINYAITLIFKLQGELELSKFDPKIIEP